MKEHCLLTVCILCAGALLLFAGKKLKFRFLLLSAFCGVCALIAADLICGLFQFGLPLNPFTLLLSAIGGIPGVILLNVLSVMLK